MAGNGVLSDSPIMVAQTGIQPIKPAWNYGGSNLLKRRSLHWIWRLLMNARQARVRPLTALSGRKLELARLHTGEEGEADGVRLRGQVVGKALLLAVLLNMR